MGLLFHFRLRDEALVSALDTPDVGTNLWACMDAVKKYLDILLTGNGTEWSSLPCEEWCRSIVVFIILYKLATGPREILDWDVTLCQSSIDPAEYLNSVAECLSLSNQTFEPREQTNDGLYFVLPAILRSARTSYLLVRDTPHLVKPGDRVHIDLSKEQIAEELGRPKEQRRCPATAFWNTSALALDQETDWCGVEINGGLDPAAQLLKNEELWRDLLDVETVDDGV